MITNVRLSLVVFFVIAGSAFATTRYVPSGGSPSYANIQAAIDASSNGDEIVVANGTFTGTGFRDIAFNGKAITVRSAYGPENCILDCQGNSTTDHRGFLFKSSEVHSSMLDGFTIKNGYANTGDGGGGISCYNSSPTIKNCIIKDCKSSIVGNVRGGGIGCRGGTPVINGCTIINNSLIGSSEGGGGGIGLWWSSAEITDCVITGNSSSFSPGSGILVKTSEVTITNCTISNNISTGAYKEAVSFRGQGTLGDATGDMINCIISNNQGAGIYLDGCYPNPTISNCVISNNLEGGIYCEEASPTITNCTIADNSIFGIQCGTSASPTISNCIIWENGDDLNNAWAIYSCIQDGDSGTGNISSNPQFADPGSDDYHLKSIGGRWTGSSWVIDSISSLCIDTGNPSANYSLEPLWNGGRINMGVYGNTGEASKSEYTLVLSVLNSNGSESIMAGSLYNITWSSNLSVGTILIEYSTDSGGNWTPVSPANSGNTGTYNWLVPEISSEECLIRISDEADPGVYDVSDGVFTIYIPTLSLINPNGGEVVLKNNPYEICWSSNYSVDDVLIEYSTNNGQDWITVDPPNVGNTGSYSWSVPEIISEECLVRISDAADTSTNDASDNVFEIGGCSLKGDLDGNCYVDFVDFGILAGNWLKSESIRIYSFNLNNDPCWTSDGEWQFGQPSGDGGTYGNPDPNKGYTGSNVYGVNLNGDYSAAVSGPYYLTAGPFDCSQYENIKLKFPRWLNSDVPDYVSCKVEVSNNGSDWTVIWEHSGGTDITDSSWQLEDYNIGDVADGEDTIYIRWSYEILDGRAYPYSGWNIDDIQLWGTR